jgi:predicted membrane protein
MKKEYLKGVFMETIISNLNRVAIFGDFNVKFTHLEQGNLVSIFGSGNADFSQANLGQHTKLTVFALFGNLQLTIPTHWKLELNVPALFGECLEKNLQNNYVEDAPAPHLIIEGLAIFGDIIITRV